MKSSVSVRISISLSFGKEENDLDTITVNNIPYSVIRLLGKGKGGYSYLAQRNGRQYVVKQIHHEPCDYYTFGNKIEAEQNDYRRLTDAKIRIPKMLDIDIENERIVKEYIDGDTVFDMVKNDVSVEAYLPQVCEMAQLAKNACNSYMDEWSFENWGVKYWSKTPEFEEYLKHN